MNGPTTMNSVRINRCRQRKLDKSTLFTILIPVYNETEALPFLFERLIAVADALPVSVEILLVNDGSKDSSFEVMCRLARQDSRFRVADLSRNFGHQLAVSAGLSVARGDVVAILDADLQDPPELLQPMLARWADGVDVVYGQRRVRDGETGFKLLTAKVYYRLLSNLTNIDIPKDTGDFRVIDREVVDIVNAMPERHRFLRGMFAWVGFRQEAFIYDRKARIAGDSKYPLRKMISFSLDGMLSFSTRPLRWMAYFGFAVTFLAFVSGLYLLGLRIFRPDAFLPGFAGMFVAMLFMFGVNFICLGVIGQYLGRAYVNIQGRPPFVIRSVVESEVEAGQSDADRAAEHRAGERVGS